MIDLRQVWNNWAIRPSKKEKAWNEEALRILAGLCSAEDGLDSLAARAGGVPLGTAPAIPPDTPHRQRCSF